MRQQALCFVVVVKLKKNYKMDVSVVWFEMRLHPEMFYFKKNLILSYPIRGLKKAHHFVTDLSLSMCFLPAVQGHYKRNGKKLQGN